MADVTLQNARIDQLPKAGYVEALDRIPVHSMSRGVTYYIEVNNLVPTQNPNFQWLSTEEYDEDEVVTYGGSWWQSQTDVNIGNIPGTNDAYWLEIPKSNGFGFWTAGVFDSHTLVVSEHSGQTRWYKLKDSVSLPFISIDIEAEEITDKWLAITEMPAYSTLVADDLMELDCKFFGNITHDISATIDDDAEIQLINDGQTVDLAIKLTVTVLGKKIKFPANFRASNALWNTGTQEWEVNETGVTLVTARNVGGIYYITNIITNLQ